MSIMSFVIDKVKDKLEKSCENSNLGKSERVLSVVAGGFIMGSAIRKVVKHPIRGFTSLSLGGALVWRGISGRCPVKEIITNDDQEENVTVIEHRYFVK